MLSCMCRRAIGCAVLVFLQTGPTVIELVSEKVEALTGNPGLSLLHQRRRSSSQYRQ